MTAAIHCKRSNRPALLACLFAVLAFAAGWGTAQPQEERGSSWCVIVDMIDTEGHAGIGLGGTFLPGGKQITYIGDQVFHEDGGIDACGFADVPSRTPILFRASSPISETFAGYSTTGHVGYATFLVPVPASQVPYGLSQRYTTDCDTRDHAVIFDIRLYLADEADVATLALDWQLSSDVRNRAVTVTADYSDGNALQILESQTAILPHAGGQFHVGVLWGEYETSPGQTDRVVLNTAVPVGPMRLSFSVDGYTTSSICLNVEDCKYYTWYTAVAVKNGENPGPSATQILQSLIPLPPDPVVIERALPWKLDGSCAEFSNITPYLDQNADEVHDIADLIAAYSLPRKSGDGAGDVSQFDVTRSAR
ncbi:hypothetical protein HZA57_00680 [Candidatus Poribacteria bacterium]|nr:hypothetical protein [Candidatus Poribacteria bacterium]